MIKFSNITWLFLSVWRRNLIVYRRIWKVNFLVPLLEPAFYILAFGFGFQGLVSGLNYDGQALGYTAFMAPALITDTTAGDLINIVFNWKNGALGKNGTTREQKEWKTTL